MKETIQTNHNYLKLVKKVPYKKNIKDIFPETLYKNKGSIFHTCAFLNINICTYYRWCKSDPDFNRSCKAMLYRLVDKANDYLWEKMEQGDTKSIIYYLKTKGRRMGWNPNYDSQFNDVSKDFVDDDEDNISD